MVLRELVAAALVLQPPFLSPAWRVVLGSQQERRGHGKAEAGKRRAGLCLSAAGAFLVGTDGKFVCLLINPGRGCDREARLRPRDAPGSQSQEPTRPTGAGARCDSNSKIIGAKADAEAEPARGERRAVPLCHQHQPKCRALVGWRTPPASA